MTTASLESWLSIAVFASFGIQCGAHPAYTVSEAASDASAPAPPQPTHDGAVGGPEAPMLASDSGAPPSVEADPPSSEAPPTAVPLAPPPATGAAEPAAPSEPTTAPASCASTRTVEAGDSNFTLEHDGVARAYILHVPENLDPSAPVPLVVDMHGLTSSATQQAALSGWRDKADAEGFIVVHPQGLNASWNGGDLCCGSSQREAVDDEGFIRAMVAQIQVAACIDPRRIYATGLSNGGAMAHLLACNAADLFAASAPVSMGNGTRPCQPSRPISVVMTRGTRDTLVAFDGGLFPSAQEDFEQWASINGCQGEPTLADELCQVFDDCAGGVEVKLCALNAGHVLYDNAQGFSVPDVAWAIFEHQVLP